MTTGNHNNETTDLRYSMSYEKLSERDFEDGIVPWVVELRVVGTPHILRAPIGKAFVLGRGDHDQQNFPDLDLTPHMGQALGVSRQHARLLAKNNRVMLEDLGSVNGTFINGQVINPHMPYRLYEGDVITLGQLQLQVHFVVKPSASDETQVGIEENLNVPHIANGERLLIVEDSFDVSMFMRVVARKAGFDVFAAYTVAEAIAMIDDAKPQAMIVELMLVDGNGSDIVRYLRSQAHGAHVPVLATTEATAGYKMGEALTEGADLFIGKPLALDEFLASLEKILTLVSPAAE